jgi:signal transduction histidine kinase
MRPPRLSLVLVLVLAGLIAACTGAVAWSAGRILTAEAEERALVTVELEAASVADAVQRSRDALAATADRLASDRTLAHLMTSPSLRRALSAYLERYRTEGSVDGIWVGAGDQTLAGAGPLPAARLSAVILRADAGPVEIHVVRELAERPADWIALSRRVAPPPSRGVTLLDRDAAGARIASPRSALRNGALATGTTRAARVGDALVGVAALRDGDRIVGLAEADVSRASATLPTRRWARQMRRVALFWVGVSILAGLLLGRRLTAPLASLARSAEAMGLGDLQTPVPRVSGRETATLSRVMEEMRLRLLDSSVELRRRQAEADAVLGGIAEGVVAVDEDRKVRYVNDRAAAILGVTSEQARGRFCGDVLRPALVDGERPCENRCPILRARAGAPASAVELLTAVGGATRTIVLTSSAPVEGRQIQLLRDETAAEATRRLRDTVVANISHEFKTPLAAQLASIEMLRDRLDVLSPEEARDLVLATERGALRLTRLVDNLLESVRLEAGDATIRRQHVELDEVVEEAVEATRPLIAQKRQSLEVEVPHPLPAVLGDAPRLVQVFVNLLANANKFAPEGAVIRLGAAAAPPHVTLWVADDGPGLPDGEDVFARFVRRAGEEPDQSGMGLGLWISRSIVERHGGRLYAAQVPAGTKLCVVLPARP